MTVTDAVVIIVLGAFLIALGVAQTQGWIG
jgi:hypothetical protein